MVSNLRTMKLYTLFLNIEGKRARGVFSRRNRIKYRGRERGRGGGGGRILWLFVVELFLLTILFGKTHGLC